MTKTEAARLLALGYRVWPIDRTTKRPTRAGFARANGPDVTASADDFDDARHEVGVLTGPCPAAGPGASYVVVDYDGPVPTDVRVGGAPTLTSKNGAHAWYRVPPGVTGFRQTQGVRRGGAGDGAWAVDTRAFGGYARETTNGVPLWDPGPTTPRDLTQAEVDALFGPASATATAPAPSARHAVPSTASIASFVHRVVANPDGTNAAFGAVGSALAAWGWADDAIAAALNAWFAGAAGAGLPGRHLDSAIRAAQTRRAGGVVPGFPRLAELGVAWAPAAPTGADDVWAVLDAADAAADDGWEYGDAIAAWDPPPIAWVCRGLALAPGAPVLLTGYGGTGKTTFAQSLALSVASGEPFLSQYAVQRGAVTHLDYEQGRDLTRRRYQQLGVGELPYDAQRRLRFRAMPPLKLTDDGAYDALVAIARDQTLVLIDSYVAASALDDENGADARRPLDVLTRVSEATGAAVLVIHHSKKDRANGRTSARGSSAITDATSAHWTFERDDSAPLGSPATLHAQKVRHFLDPRETGTLDGTAIGLDVDGRPRVIGDAGAIAERAALTLAERVVEHLALHGAVASATALRRELKCNKEELLACLGTLEAQGVIAPRSKKNAEIRLSENGTGKKNGE